MCKFCDENRVIKVPIRCMSAEDNICNNLREDNECMVDCNKCNGCKEKKQLF